LHPLIMLGQGWLSTGMGVSAVWCIHEST
jgi:hypothetical protein